MKSILIIYYTQSGLQKEIIDRIINPLNGEYQLDYYKITVKKDYPFPWTNKAFYDVMPECVEGIPTEIEIFDIKKKYDLVILAYQVWFLAPSIPVWSLIKDDNFQKFIANKKVITVLGVRNMWVNAHNRVSKLLKENNAQHIGNIVLTDPNPNLISVLTVAKFATTGIKKPFKKLPPYGPSEETMNRLDIFGNIIHESFEKNNWETFQERVVENNGVAINFTLKSIENTGSKIFKLWSAFILKKGQAGNPSRQGRLKMYKIYLYVLLFGLSPIVSLIFMIIGVLFYPITSKELKRISLMK